MTTEVHSPFASEIEVILRPFCIRVGYLERLHIKIVSSMAKAFANELKTRLFENLPNCRGLNFICLVSLECKGWIRVPQPVLQIDGVV